MINSIALQNFKCYEQISEFSLGKINLLTGINGKGKSSFLQSLLLFRQSVEHDVQTTKLLLNGSSVRLGTFSDLKNSDTPHSKEVSFTFIIKKDNIIFEAYYAFTSDDKNDRVLLLKDSRLKSNDKLFVPYSLLDANKYTEIWISFDEKEKKYLNNKTESNEDFYGLFPDTTKLKPAYSDRIDLYEILNFQNIHYVSADRLGPQEFYTKNNLGDFIHVGKQGELAADVFSYAQREQLTVNPDIARSINRDVRSQTSEWLGFILDNPNFSIQLDDSDKYRSSIAFNMKGKSYTPPNVGFGYSYTLPIVLSGLIAKKDEILIIENPEAHLHPRAQSRLAQFLAKVASLGVQVIIESHSEHILNGIRIASISPDIGISNDEVSIFYFHEKGNELFTQLPIEQDGSIKNWVDGFFDQQEIDLSELFKLNRAKK